MTQHLISNDCPCSLCLLFHEVLSSLPTYTSLSFSCAKPAVSAPSVESHSGKAQSTGLKVLQHVYGVRSVCSM